MKVIGVPNKRYTTGIGYIIIPADVDRDKFVIDCLRKEKVSIITQNGEYINGVYIDRDCIQRIEFPEVIEETGSCVVYVNEYVHNHPIIIGVIAKGNENQLLNEYEFRLIKKTKAGIVSITGKADTSELFIGVLSDNNNGGNMTIDLSNQTKSSNLIMNVKGDIALNSTNRIVHNQGNEPILKGNELVKELDKITFRIDGIIDAIKNGIIVPSDGGASLKATIVAALNLLTDKEVFDKVKSEQSFIK